MTECTPEVQWAHNTAYRKANHTADTWQGRTACKKFTNVFLGDLAKNIFKKFVLLHNPDAVNSLVEYDLIRTDEFRNPDQFDLKLMCRNEECVIEVKSSGEKSSNNLMEIYNNRRIIINVGNVHQHYDCIYAQIMFIPENLAFFQNEDFICTSLIDFSNQYVQDFLSQNIKAYIVGYASEPMQRAAVQNVITMNNQNANAKKRSYADLLIRESKSPHLFLQAIPKPCNHPSL
jgi:hypothetical protein